MLPVVAAALAFVAATAAVAIRTAVDVEIPGRPELARYGMYDFRDAVYYPVIALLDGRNPYDPATYRAAYPVGSKFPLYLPLALAVHLPFALLPRRPAEVAHFAVGVGAMVLLAALALRASRRRSDAAWLLGVAAATVASRPGHTNLFLGECAAYAICGAYLAILFPARPVLAAAGLALAWMKPTFGLPLTLLLLARGDRRTAISGTAIAAAISLVVLIPLLIVEGGARGFLDAMRANYFARGATEAYTGANVLAIDAGAFVARLVGRAPGAVLDPLDLTASLVVLGLGAAAVRRRALAGDATAPLTTAVICLAVLLGIHHESYDALLVLLPMTALATGAWQPAARGTGALRWALLALLAVPAANYLATFRLIEKLHIEGVARLVVTSANGGATLVAFLVCVVLALSRRPPASLESQSVAHRAPAAGEAHAARCAGAGEGQRSAPGVR